jgi:N-acetylglutamate synthase-like GNAT family acetyltransferase
MPRLRATPLAAFERDGLKAALRKVGLPCDDVERGELLVWRFETEQDVPVGFGALEIFGRDALLRSVVALPPLRHHGFGTAIVARLEIEARALNCRAVYAVTIDADLFTRNDFTACAADEVPAAVRASAPNAHDAGVGAGVMRKSFE